MDAEGWSDSPGDVGVPQSCLADELRNVFSPVASWRKEPGEDDDSVSAESDAGIEGLLDRRLGKFHMGRFDDCVAAVLSESASSVVEQRVTFGAAGTVIDKKDGGDGVGQAGATPGYGMDSAFFAFVFFTSPAARGITLGFFGSSQQLLKETFGLAGLVAFCRSV